MTLYGFDINGAKGKEPGVLDKISEGDFVILKATEGKSWHDPYTQDYAKRFRQEGKKIGWYHFAWPDNGWEADLNNFLYYAKPQPGETVWLDFEPYNQKSDETKWPTYVLKFLEGLAALTDSIPGIYLNNDMGTRLQANMTDLQKKILHNYPLWKAAYGSSPGNLLGWHYYTLWQYSDLTIDQDRMDGEDLWENICIPRAGVKVSDIVTGANDPAGLGTDYFPVKRSFINRDGKLFVVADIPAIVVPDPPPVVVTPDPPPVVNPPTSGDNPMPSGKVYLSKLHFGQQDSDSVKAMQEALNGTSFPPHTNVPVTGNYLEITDQSVRDWQTFIGDTPDPAGQSSIGPKQAAKLFAPWPVEIINDLSNTQAPPASTGTVDTPFPGAVVGTPFGKKGGWAAGYHTGRDYPCPVGTPLRSTWTCKVVAINAWGAAYGNHVIMEHTSKGVVHRIAYCHMSVIAVNVGDSLVPNQYVGKSGNTGNTTGPHVHVEDRTAPFKYANVVHDPVL